MFFWNRSGASEFENYGWDETDPPPTAWYVQRLLLFGLIVVGCIGLSAVVFDQAMAEKSVTALLQPVGLIWLGLSLVIYFCFLWRRYIAASACVLCWFVLTVAGNQIVCNSLATSLESRYYHMNPFEGESLEYGMLLGGGTSSAPNGQSQANSSGDRVVVACRMYRANQIKKIICSGSNSSVNRQPKSPAESAIEVLKGLGIPEEDLISLEGANTFEEIANLKLWVDEQNEAGKNPGRLALISSAWHLPRVQRLANELELDVSPMPANFLSAPLTATPHMVIPGAYQLQMTSLAVKEFLASVVKR